LAVFSLSYSGNGRNMISVFDIFKIGIGPSSSHTVGPMKAGKQFADDLIAQGILQNVTRVVVDVYGSLSLTGKGHHTDIAIIMGLAGNMPDTVDIDAIPDFIQDVNTHGRLLLANGQREVEFPVDSCMNFHEDNLSLHENGMRITALAGSEVIYSQTYYSIGGGFIVDEAHFGLEDTQQAVVPYPYKSAADLQRHCKESGLSLSGLMMLNERALRTQSEIDTHFANIWDVMRSGIERGITTEGVLPGKMRVPRRAAALRRMLVSSDKNNSDPMAVVDWINMFALAVNEENAAGGRVVTAPTNGACGIVPAVLAYYDKFIREVNTNSCARYFLAAGAIGSLYKMNASISGAEVGCQGEVGVACSMAAAGLAELLGGSPSQVCIAAEIGMEHNLGLTCDPVAGQVQVPCIERNAIAAVKAVNAARMALRRTSEPRVCLDKVIDTMYETGKDMNAKYRETSRGGLAMKVSCD
jgi:L-serine dehydratase